MKIKVELPTEQLKQLANKADKKLIRDNIQPNLGKLLMMLTTAAQSTIDSAATGAPLLTSTVDTPNAKAKYSVDYIVRFEERSDENKELLVSVKITENR